MTIYMALFLGIAMLPMASAETETMVLRPDTTEFFEDGMNAWLSFGLTPDSNPCEWANCVNETVSDGNSTIITTDGTLGSPPITAVGLVLEQCEGNPICNNVAWIVDDITFSYVGRKNTSSDPSIFSMSVVLIRSSTLTCTNETVSGVLSQAYSEHDSVLSDCNGSEFTTSDINGALQVWFWFDTPRTGDVTITQVFATVTLHSSPLKIGLDVFPLLVFVGSLTLLIIAAVWIRDRKR